MRLPYKIRNAIWLHKSYEIRHQNRRDLLIARDETRERERETEMRRDTTCWLLFSFLKIKPKCLRNWRLRFVSDMAIWNGLVAVERGGEGVGRGVEGEGGVGKAGEATGRATVRSQIKDRFDYLDSSGNSQGSFTTPPSPPLPSSYHINYLSLLANLNAKLLFRPARVGGPVGESRQYVN